MTKHGHSILGSRSTPCGNGKRITSSACHLAISSPLPVRMAFMAMRWQSPEHGFDQVDDARMIDERFEDRAMLEHTRAPAAWHAEGLGVRGLRGEGALDLDAQTVNFLGCQHIRKDKKSLAL